MIFNSLVLLKIIRMRLCNEETESSKLKKQIKRLDHKVITSSRP